MQRRDEPLLDPLHGQLVGRIETAGQMVEQGADILPEQGGERHALPSRGEAGLDRAGTGQHVMLATDLGDEQQAVWLDGTRNVDRLAITCREV